MIIVEGDVINNLEEAANWLREAWIYEPYNIYYVESWGKAFIEVEPVKDRNDLYGYIIESLEEFEKFIKTH